MLGSILSTSVYTHTYIHTLSFNPHKNSWSSYPHFTDEETNAEKGEILPKVIQPVSKGAGIQKEAAWLHSYYSIHHIMLLDMLMTQERKF